MKTQILTALFLMLGFAISAQNVNIPDTNFKNALILAGVDISVDGEISYSEAEAIKKIEVIQMEIADMTGIEAFVNLDTLNCSSNQITSLDVSGFAALAFLDCYNNELTSLDVSGCSALYNLVCVSNQLTSLDISGCNALTFLNCLDNQLTSLDVSGFAALTYLNCNENQLISLDVSGCTSLISLNCQKNLLTSLDVSGCITLSMLNCQRNQLVSLDVSECSALAELYCQINQLTSLDVSNNTALYYLYCDANQLTSLDITNNNALVILNLIGMPTLHKVCVWEMPFPPANVDIDTTVSPNVYFTTDCSTDMLDPQEESLALNIFPNPVKNLLNIKFNLEITDNTIIGLIDISGKVLYNETLKPDYASTHTIDFSSFQEGIYFLRIYNKEFSFVENVVKFE